ncbi:hypothetical protein LV476_02955 [Guyparkeria hydrothermalis]|uniref:hypothetical protein n=1 Tax=Guyparkeria hydrothermalis TaxID=923 RepID=UPI0020201CE8|nr:hypothetical protein [Guyparkeria hydrothermalis]MCL7743911.1 hypothetical protein [Guyparkeria hydrothermalis]
MAQLTGSVLTPERATAAAEVNESREKAANGPLEGILGYETQPLSSVDYTDDPSSTAVDAPSTTVIDDELEQVMAGYGTE